MMENASNEFKAKAHGHDPNIEEKQGNFDHDGFWKDLIERFCYYVVKRAVPKLYEELDTDKEPRFLNTEFTDVLNTGDPQIRINPHFVDILSDLPLKSGVNVSVLFHCEAEKGYSTGDLAERMNHYRCFIYAHYRREPVALAIIVGARRKNDRFYSHSHFGTRVVYEYNNLVLSELYDEELKASDNPVDLALYAAKCALKAKEELQKYKYLRTLLELLAERGWSKKDKEDLLLFLERIINLKDKELEKQYTEYRGQLTKEGKIMYIPLGERELAKEIEQRGIALGMEKGRERGREEGREEGRQEGMVKGMEKGREEMARNLLANGVSPEIIAKSGYMPVEQVRALIS